MGLELKGIVGPQVQADGTLSDLRLGRSGEGIVQELHGRYFETNFRGNVFTACNASAGVAPGTALSTTPPFTLYNPKGNNRNLVVLKAAMGYISGTLGGGTVVFGVNNDPAAAAPTGGTALTPQSNMIGTLTPTGKAFTGATLPAAPTIFRPFCSLLAITAATALQPFQNVEEVAGDIIIAPGCALSLQAIAAAGTSPLVIFGMTWEEVPI